MRQMVNLTRQTQPPSRQTQNQLPMRKGDEPLNGWLNITIRIRFAAN